MEVLHSLSEKELEELYKEVLHIFDIYKDKYKEAFLLGEFIETNYDSLLKDRFKAIKKKYGELNYEVLNKDKIIRNLKAKIDDKASIRELLQNIYEKYNLTQYTVTLDFLSFVIHVKGKRQKKKYRENTLYKRFESIYDKIIESLKPTVDPNIEQECFTFFLEIWNRIKKGTKLRAPEILSPITIFMCFYMKGIHLEIKNICRRIKMTDKEFRQILNETIKIYPEYLKRDREILVRNKLELFKTELRFPDEFIVNANAILEKFWPFIQHTTETVIAGTIAILTVIGMDIKTYNYTQICKKIRCSQSAVLYQIKNKIFKTLNIPGFESIRQSREMIKELIIKNIDIKLP